MLGRAVDMNSVRSPQKTTFSDGLEVEAELWFNPPSPFLIGAHQPCCAVTNAGLASSVAGAMEKSFRQSTSLQKTKKLSSLSMAALRPGRWVDRPQGISRHQSTCRSRNSPVVLVAFRSMIR